MRRLPLLTLLLLSFPLAGCETLGLTTPAPPDFAQDMGPICPATAVLSDAVIVTKLKPGTQAAPPNPANVPPAIRAFRDRRCRVRGRRSACGAGAGAGLRPHRSRAIPMQWRPRGGEAGESQSPRDRGEDSGTVARFGPLRGCLHCRAW